MSRASFVILVPLTALGLFLAGCGSDSTSGSNASASCAPSDLNTVKSGVLTVATDKPAYPPYFEDNDPTNGKGFESAVAYAIADELGYAKADVTWTTEPFNASYAPGPKNFDFDVNEISITPPREKAVDFSSPYYTAKQAVVVPKGSDFTEITSFDDLKDASIGVQVGTTSYDAVKADIDPSDLKVFDNSNDVVTALKNKQVDAVVVDVPTALYVTAVQVPGSIIAGQFPAPGGDEWGALLAKNSSLTDCVSQAVDSLKESGKLSDIEDQWINKATDAPDLD